MLVVGNCRYAVDGGYFEADYRTRVTFLQVWVEAFQTFEGVHGIMETVFLGNFVRQFLEGHQFRVSGDEEWDSDPIHEFTKYNLSFFEAVGFRTVVPDSDFFRFVDGHF